MTAAAACPTAPLPARTARRRFCTAETGDPARAGLEAFIAGVYAAHHGARVAHWAPTLVALETDGGLAAAAGYRRAASPLYLEHYLDVPVEAAIAARTGHRVDRSTVCEVGHFASNQPGEGRRLLLLLARHLARIGCRWVVSTATRELRELLIGIGLTPYALAPADASRLPDGAAAWGRYYDHAPVVVAGDLLRNLAALERRGGAR